MIPIYIIGSSNTDMVVKSERLPKRGETVMGGTFYMNAGGKGANQAVAAARLGGKVTLIACVGNDVFGQQAINHFRNEGINTYHVSTDPHLASGVALIHVDRRGENSIAVAPGANGSLKFEKIENALAEATTTSIILIQLEIPLTIVTQTISHAVSKGHHVILNPAPAQKLRKQLLKGLYLITPNASEAELLTGVKVNNQKSAEKAARKLKNTGVANVIITMGAKGAYLHSQEDSQIIPAPKVKAVDTTGAGDCFNGALAVALSKEISLVKAVTFAVKAASISVTRQGAQSSMPFGAELLR